MDAAGAAIATVTAQALSVVFAIVILIKKELPFKITRKDFGLNSQCKKFLKIGLPLALQEFLTQMSFLALCAFVNRLGLEASSGYGVACKIVNFAMLVPSALMQSMASFVSQNIGAGKANRNRCWPGCGMYSIFIGDVWRRYTGRVLHNGCSRYPERVCISERIRTGNNRDSNSVQYGRIFQW